MESVKNGEKILRKMFMGKLTIIYRSNGRICLQSSLTNPIAGFAGLFACGVGDGRVMIIQIGFNFGVEATYSVLFTYFPGVF